MKRILQLLCLSFLLLPQAQSVSQVRVGAEMLLRDQFRLIEGKRVGLIANQTSRLPDGRHLVSVLITQSNVKLVALFSPEHGFRGAAPAGELIETERERETGIPIHSLYGQTLKPTPAMLEGIDLLLFDIQDVGVRFFTYISTMSYAMEAAAERGIPFVVLDRPNPITGSRVAGFVVHDTLRSFVGLHPIPIVHGMTVGELALLINEEGWLRNGVKADLHVVKMEGWKRELWFDQTGLIWVKPSPNIMTPATTIVYPATCYFEGTNISEGRGTDQPFEIIGAPFLDGKKWAAVIQASQLNGVRFHPVTFVPRDIENVATNPKFKGESCNGVRLEVVDRKAFDPIRTGLVLLSTARALAPEQFRWRDRSVDRLFGTSRVRLLLRQGIDPSALESIAGRESHQFKSLRKKYLLYD